MRSKIEWSMKSERHDQKPNEKPSKSHVVAPGDPYRDRMRRASRALKHKKKYQKENRNRHRFDRHDPCKVCEGDGCAVCNETGQERRK